MPVSDHLRSVLPAPDLERASYLTADLAANIDQSEIGTILDMGAGSGSMTAACLDVFPQAQATVVDVVARLELDRFLDQQRLQNVRTLDWPAEAELAGQEFDLVLSMDVLEHIPAWAGALQGLFAHVRPGGYLYIQAPSRYPSPNWPTKSVFLNRLKGYLGKNDPAGHVRHGLSCKEILDVCTPAFSPVIAAESYTVDGVCYCAFKPRTHLLLRKAN